MFINKKVYHKFFIEKEFEAGIVLKGWEVKALRAKKVSINDSYVFFRSQEAYLYGIKFTPLCTTEKKLNFKEKNEHKILLKNRELNFIFGYISKKKYKVVLISLYWKNAWAKLKIGIAKSKEKYDHRSLLKKQEWKIYRKKILNNNFK